MTMATTQYSFTEKKRVRKDFGKSRSILEVPFLLAIQVDSYREFLQEHIDSAKRDDRGLHAAVAVSVPFRLDQCADRIGLGFSRVYQAHFMRELTAYVQSKKRSFASNGATQHLSILEQLGPLDGMRTFWDFDGQITAPLHGYADADDYYRRASSRYFLGAIRIPTLLIQAADDPFVFRHSVPEPSELAPGTELELHTNGGHVGFIDGSLRKPDFYLERRIPQWLSQQG